jgi:hypothetical protein
VWCEDGTVLSGLLQAVDGERVIVRVPAGETVERPRREVAAIEPMKTSLMPEGLERILTPDGIEDLITFLLGAPLEPAPLTRLDPAPPPARTRAEITPFLPPGAAAPAEPQPLRVLLAAGQKDHGIDEHDYPLWLERWSRLLSLADRVTVATAGGFPTREELAAADVTVFNSSNPGWDADRAALLDEYQRRGGGLVYLHWSIEGHRHAEALAERVGFAFSASKFRHGPMELVFPQTGHPITRGFTRLPLLDEAYWALRGDAGRVSVLATSEEEGAPRPQLWTLERHQGRVFGCIPGHYTWTFDDPLYRLLVLRGIAWAARQEDVHRLAELATIGARVAP